MNRLTKRNSNGVAYMSIAETLAKWEQEIEGSQAILEGVYAIFQKLAAYEDTGLEPQEVYKTIKAGVPEWIPKYLEYRKLEEQGLLIKLPCKIGQDLYIVSNRVDGKGHVRRLTLTHNNLGNVLKRLDDDIFKTREEAEKALEASNGE